MLMESLFAVVDVYFVSKVSVNAVATVGLTESVLMIIYSIAVGLSMAATAIVARRIGEKDPKRASSAAFQALILSVTIGIVLGTVGLIFAGDILKLMGGEPELIEEGIDLIKAAHDGLITAYPDSGCFKPPNWDFEEVISPADLVTFAAQWKTSGANVIGGCCGLGPSHIEALAKLS